ncbi:GTP-binding protein YPTM2 [Pelomyxa schiedti]|nr:GTP-binding protein YPTM2 [Pelomyxa schiedti]
MSAGKNYDYLAKLLLIGDHGVGKTCLLLRFVEDHFSPTFISTIGVDFKVRTVQIASKILKAQIWDTAGEERFRTITSAYYRGCSGIIVTYDITDRSSFQHIPEWLRSIDTNCRIPPRKILVGTKLDLATPHRAVEYSQAKAFAEENGLKFWETSSKDSTNVDEAIMALLADVKTMHEDEEDAEEACRQRAATSTVALKSPPPPTNKTSRC